MVKKIFANLFDEIILLGVAAILMFLTNLILGAAGYKVLQPAVFLTAYLFIANVVYFSIMENSTTLGKRIVKPNGSVKTEVIKEEKIEEKIEEIKAETNDVK